MRYRFRCEYLGSAFYGWQEQNESGRTKFVTVQSALQEAFSIASRECSALIQYISTFLHLFINVLPL